jgi:glycosyltransferase involved in cell wall biosynthesis
MACILKAPSKDSKGVVIFTTPERDICIKDNTLQKRIWSLKDKWLVGLHHNWHDHKFVYNPLFDFSMAGEEDLREASGKSVPLLPMDACNFVPECFKPSRGEKFWDILYVARAVFFKKIPEFFQSIRSLYDRVYKCRVLFICPVPPYDRKQESTVFYKVRDFYDEMFSEEEKDLFTLLTLDYRYPFPFDLPTLAYFYRSSRIFVHSADEERRCRVAAYAWASGIPVVGMSCVGSLLPKDLRIPPFFYEASAYSRFPDRIIQALNDSYSNTNDFENVREYVSVNYTIPTLQRWLETLFHSHGLDFDGKHLSYANLDIRLGRHTVLGCGLNTVGSPLRGFIDILQSPEEVICKLISEHQDPEIELARFCPFQAKPSFLRKIWKLTT